MSDTDPNPFSPPQTPLETPSIRRKPSMVENLGFTYMVSVAIGYLSSFFVSDSTAAEIGFLFAIVMFFPLWRFLKSAAEAEDRRLERLQEGKPLPDVKVILINLRGLIKWGLFCLLVVGGYLCIRYIRT